MKKCGSSSMPITKALVLAAIVALLSACEAPNAALTVPPAGTATVRCGAIGGMVESGFWKALSERYERATGDHVDLVASGPKEEVERAFRKGGLDVIVMHSSDAMINLCADGVATDPQPWMRNDILIVGPADDPAGIRGQTSALTAFKKIAKTKSAFVVHSSLGAQEVLKAILEEGEITLDPEHTTILFDDKQRRVLKVAAEKKAYTLVGRIPFRDGKIPNDGLVAMVQGDSRLRRPYLVATADPQRLAGTHVGEAHQFVAFLRSAQTQQWIATYGKGQLDDQPLFFPLGEVPPAK